MIELQGLNACQESAVKAVHGPVMVLAGAGSGKTRVLTNRIAYMVNEAGIDPDNILAITFTNKAANEMSRRLENLLDGNTGRMLVSTIHSMCSRILRYETNSLHGRYSSGFSIYTSAESEHVMKNVLKKFTLTESESKINFLYHAGTAKNEALTPEEYFNEYLITDKNGELIREVIEKYNETLKENNAMDFDDLLYNCYTLFKNDAEVLEKYRKRFLYMSVDEFQDTNRVQYLMLRLLAEKHGNIFVVGDDDQSIYGWRGADIRNIYDFKKDFPEVKIIKLEQNYRSTKKILEAANKIISGNSERFEKKLWTDNETGSPVTVYAARTEGDEAYYVVNKIAWLISNEGYRQKDFAVLMRMNATSRAFEQEFMKYGVKYKVFGGFRFFERKEIKDIIAYLRLTDNPFDNEAFARIINFPKRGIGEKTLSLILDAAQEKGMSALEVAGGADGLQGVTTAVKRRLKEFFTVINELSEFAEKENVLRLVEELYRKVDIRGALENVDDNFERAMHADEFLQAAEDFIKSFPDGKLRDFLQTVSLQSDSDSMDDGNYVTIATVHSAKGLEFSNVFIIGVESGIFPIARAMYDAEELNEERRLMYVAVTRAMKNLFVTRCESRFLHGERRYMSGSEFFREIGELAENESAESEALDESEDEKASPSIYTRSYANGRKDIVDKKEIRAKQDEYRSGMKIMHRSFGIGLVISVNKDKIDVAFKDIGVKTLSLEYAPIKILEK